MIAYTFAALLLFYLAYTLVLSFVHARRAKSLGCLPPTTRHHRLPFGVDHLQRMSRADKQHIVPNDLVAVHRELGCPSTFQQKFLGVWNYLTVDPKNIQALLATQFQDFELGPRRRGNFMPMLGHGIFTSDGKAWEHSRSLLRPQFTRQQIADLELEESHVQDLFKHLVPDEKGWTAATDLSPLFFRLTLDSATQFLFGESVNCQVAALANRNGTSAKDADADGDLDWTSFAPAFDAGTMALGHRARLMTFYWAHNPQSFRDDIRKIHRFADYYVNLALEQHRLEEKNGPDVEKRNYVFLRELVKATQDPIELRSQLLNILLAGRDTTAGLLGWVFYCLARDQQRFNKLREVILETFGTDNCAITFESLKTCTYLQHVLSETLRLYPTVPVNGRTATKDTTLPRGGGPDGSAPVYVKKGTEVTYSVHIMHHRKDIWGEDADEFRPERWVGRKAGWEFLPFNGGPRICLGQQFALTEAGYVIVRMLQKYDKLENCDADPVPRHHYSITTSPEMALMKLHEAGDAA